MNLKNILIVAAIGTMFSFTSCKNDKPANTEPTPVVQPNDATITPAATAPAPTSTDVAPSNSQQIQIQPSNIAPAQTAPAGGGSGKINPAHGQPGHSCAVPVGSPLPN